MSIPRRKAETLTFVLALTFAVLICASSLDVRGTRPADTTGLDLEILFPRPGQVLCCEEQFEIVATHRGSHILPDGSSAVLEIGGSVVSELYSGALSARLPLLHDGEARVEVKLTIFQQDGNEAASKELAIEINTAAGCEMRPAPLAPLDDKRLHWMEVGFSSTNEDDGNALLVLHSMENWLASLISKAQRIEISEVRRLSTHDVLLLLLNAQDVTAPFAMETLLRDLTKGRGAPRVGLLHVLDIDGAASRHFYPDLDFVLRSYCREPNHRGACVPVGLGHALIPLPSSPQQSATADTSGAAEREYVWTFVGSGLNDMVGREGVVRAAMRYSPDGLVLDTFSSSSSTSVAGGSEEGDGGAQHVWQEWRAVFRNTLAVLIIGDEEETRALVYEALEAGALPVVRSALLLLSDLGADHKLLTLELHGAKFSCVGSTKVQTLNTSLTQKLHAHTDAHQASDAPDASES